MTGGNDPLSIHGAEIEHLKQQIAELRRDMEKQEHSTGSARLTLEKRLTTLENQISFLEQSCKKHDGRDKQSRPLMHIFYVSVVVYILFGEEPAIKLLMGFFK